MEDNAAAGVVQGWTVDPAYRSEAYAPLDPRDLFPEDALRAVIRDPRFRAVTEALADEATGHFQRLDATSRWLLKDLGRTSIYVAALAMYAFLGGLTQSALVGALVTNGVASRSRVIAFVDHAIGAGRLEVTPGFLPWTQRPLIPSPLFVEVLRDRLAGALRAIGRIDVAVALAADRLSNDRTLAAAFVLIGRTSGMAQAHGAPYLPHVEFFMQRDGGLKVLQDLLTRQEPDRTRLLEAVSFSKTDIARSCGVSRIHLDTLLRDAETAGLLTLNGRNRIVFHPALNDSYELWVALQIQGARLVAETVLARQT